MDFEWDENKRAENLRKHDFDFADVEQLWKNRPWANLPERMVRGEARSVRVGQISGKYWTMVYTWRGKERSMPVSKDGSKTISVQEFDELFDSGSDEIDDYIDWDGVRTHRDTVGLELELPWDFVEWMRRVASSRGITVEQAAENFVADQFRASFTTQDAQGGSRDQDVA